MVHLGAALASRLFHPGTAQPGRKFLRQIPLSARISDADDLPKKVICNQGRSAGNVPVHIRSCSQGNSFAPEGIHLFLVRWSGADLDLTCKDLHFECGIVINLSEASLTGLAKPCRGIQKIVLSGMSERQCEGDGGFPAWISTLQLRAKDS